LQGRFQWVLAFVEHAVTAYICGVGRRFCMHHRTPARWTWKGWVRTSKLAIVERHFPQGTSHGRRPSCRYFGAWMLKCRRFCLAASKAKVREERLIAEGLLKTCELADTDGANFLLSTYGSWAR
jgi:hypothetical protein